MRFGRLIAATAALACSTLAGQAQAATRIDFTSTSAFNGPLGSFSVIIGLRGYNRVISADAFESCTISVGYACAGTYLGVGGGPNMDGINFMFTNPTLGSGGTILYFFAPNALRTPGTHQTVLFNGQQDATITVTHVDGRAPVGEIPEPVTWAMMILGMGATGGALRRRRHLLAQA